MFHVISTPVPHLKLQFTQITANIQTAERSTCNRIIIQLRRQQAEFEGFMQIWKFLTLPE